MKMNIALLTMGFSKNSGESTKITTINFAKELIKHGHNVVIIQERSKPEQDEGQLEKFEEIEGVRIYRPYYLKGFRKKQNKRYIKEFVFFNFILTHAFGVRYVQKKLGIKFDIIHNFGAAPLTALRPIIGKTLFSRKSKIINTIKSEPKDYSFSRILNQADAITTSLRSIARELIKKGCNPKKICLIKSHINLKKFQPLNKLELRKKYNYKNKKIIFYYGTRIEVIDAIIKAADLLLKENTDLLFILAIRSGAKFCKEYEKMIEEAGLKKNFEVKGRLKNIEEYINMADIVLLPYPNLLLKEANPSALLEAMACKIPIITTNLPELKEIVTPGKDVLMINPNNPESLAKNINYILSNKKLQKKLIEHAYKTVQKFDVKKVTKQFVNLYKKCLKSL